MGKLADIVVDGNREQGDGYSGNVSAYARDFSAGMNGFGLEHVVFVNQNKLYHVLLDGVIYNRIELKRKLLEHDVIFETDTDHEIILALYVLNDERCVQSLRGMFAFAIWDEQEETLFAARDPFGIKPFYYWETDEGLFFGSEQKPLMALDNDNPIVQETFQHYLTYQYVPEPYSLTNAPYKLKPGHYLMKKGKNGPSVFTYYRKSFSITNKNFRYYIDKTRAALEDSIAHHMIADVPIGAFLSSGIDSTIIVALAKRYQDNLKTVTVGFENQAYNETDIAKATAERLGVEHVSKLITPEEFVEALPEIVRDSDSPVADPAAVPLYFAAKEARKHVGVILSGEGADELFGGYNIYREPLALKGFNYIPRVFKNLLKQLAIMLPEGVKGKSYLLRGTTPLADRYIGNAKIFSEAEKEELLMHYQQGAPFTDITKPLFNEAASYDASLKMQYIDLNTWIPGDVLLKAENMTSAHDLELRSPFLDNVVFEAAQEIPTKYKIAKQTTKYVLREAVKDIVPENILYRKKWGFPVPLRHWLRHELYDWARGMIERSPTDHLLKKDVILSLLDEHALKKKDNSRKIWVLLVFLQWYAERETDKRYRGRAVLGD
ncbi:MAG TPA: asparagine synthase (glutamine-hydrolyzing) [Virgibacillus sp.]|nr:asparagine synthase (glutamine-hydrolyzing) [Virgibacillus sp.]